MCKVPWTAVTNRSRERSVRSLSAIPRPHHPRPPTQAEEDRRCGGFGVRDVQIADRQLESVMPPNFSRHWSRRHASSGGTGRQGAAGMRSTSGESGHDGLEPLGGGVEDGDVTDPQALSQLEQLLDDLAGVA